MEERLFFIGLAMAAYAYLSRHFKQNKTLNTANKVGLWHALFCAMAGFSICLVLVMSMDTRSRFTGTAVDVFSTSEIYPSLAVALVAALIPDLPAWTPAERRALLAVMRAKGSGTERAYSRRLDGHRRLLRSLEVLVRG